jgi:diguanylate cyclase
MNTPNAGDRTDWKARCIGLLDELERRKRERREVESWFSRLLARVTTSVLGLDEKLDPLLLRIRDLVRGTAECEDLKSELDGLTEKLAQIVKESQGQVSSPGKEPRKPNHDDNSQLIGFLKSLMINSQELSALGDFHGKIERGEFINDAALFEDLHQLLEAIFQLRPATPEEEAGAKPGFLRRLLGKKEAPTRIDRSAVQSRLIALLEAIEFPRAGQGRANQLVARLRRDLSTEAFFELFQEIIDFAAKMKASAESEQKSLDEFLSDLTDKLLQLEKQTVGVRDLTRASEADSEARHTTFAEQVEGLRASTNAATELEGLKSLVNARLTSISDYLETERKTELNRSQETELQVEQLTGRLHDLEMEAGDLRAKLRIEHNLSMRDVLTGLPNRKAFDERIEQEIGRWNRLRSPFCLLIWDIDHFKSINDRFGHKAGDKALVTIAEELSTSLRDVDFVGRFGGEEFVMLLAGMEQQMALQAAEQIRGKVAECGFNSSGKPVKITISCGVGQFVDGETAEQLFERTDRALYRAKHDGRNRCATAY